MEEIKSLPSLIVIGLEDYDYFGTASSTPAIDAVRYLGVIAKGSDHENCLRFDSKASDRAAKFAVELAKCGGGLVHIKSCHTNKYWCSKEHNGNEKAIVAEASEAVEDKSSSKCTLFTPVVHDEERVKLKHVHSNLYVSYSNDLMVISNSTGMEAQYLVSRVRIMDYESLVQLPRFVAFQGPNDKYLTGYNMGGIFKFAETDLSSDSIVNEVYQSGDGKIRLKNLKENAFWESTSWGHHVVSYTDYASWKHKVFQVVNLDYNNNGIVALRSLGNDNNFCQYREIDQTLSACAGMNPTKETALRVVEPVRRREVRVEFDMDAAKITDQTAMVMAETSAENWSTVETDDLQLEQTVEYTESHTWSNTVGAKVGVETSFKTGIPFIAEGEISVSVEASYEHQWDKTKEDKKSTKASFTMKVSPMTRGSIKMVATKGTCDVPFSYTQVDTLYNYQKVKTKLNDGIYKGVQYYNFSYQTRTETLEEPNKLPFEAEPNKLPFKGVVFGTALPHI